MRTNAQKSDKKPNNLIRTKTEKTPLAMTELYEQSYCPVAAVPESTLSHTVNSTARSCSKTQSSQRKKHSD